MTTTTTDSSRRKSLRQQQHQHSMDGARGSESEKSSILLQCASLPVGLKRPTASRLATRSKRASYGSLADSLGGNLKQTPEGWPPVWPHQVAEQQVCLSDIIGDFGLFQFLVLLFSGLREAIVGYDAIIMSVLLQPHHDFTCTKFGRPADESLLQSLANSTDPTVDGASGPDPQCYDAARGQVCETWEFARADLVAKWSLVCQNHWLVAFIETAYFLGLVSGNLVWGFCADRFGRRPAYLISHSCGLLFSALGLCVDSVWLFAGSRFLSAFGAVGFNIIYSIQVEIIGAKYRSSCTILNHFGWGLGVLLVPFVYNSFQDYRLVIGLVPILTLIMLPAAFWLPESSRWLMANGELAAARREILRGAKFNGRAHRGASVDKKISMLEYKLRLGSSDEPNGDLEKKTGGAGQQPKELTASGNGTQAGNKLAELLDGEQARGKEEKHLYKIIFTTPKYLRDTIMLAYAAFTGYLFYYLLTINFAYVKNLSTEANFIISGVGDWISVCVGAVLLRFLTRRACMTLFTSLMVLSFLFQSLIDLELAQLEPYHLDSATIQAANNAVGTLSASMLIFIVLIVNQEVYPTIVRQTGTSITNTLADLGSTLAPMLIQMGRLIGQWRADLVYAAISLLSMVAVQFVTKTDDIELLDT